MRAICFYFQVHQPYRIKECLDEAALETKQKLFGNGRVYAILPKNNYKYQFFIKNGKTIF